MPLLLLLPSENKIRPSQAKPSSARTPTLFPPSAGEGFPGIARRHPGCSVRRARLAEPPVTKKEGKKDREYFRKSHTSNTGIFRIIKRCGIRCYVGSLSKQKRTKVKTVIDWLIDVSANEKQLKKKNETEQTCMFATLYTPPVLYVARLFGDRASPVFFCIF